MKKYLILTLISSLLISSCTIDWKDENKGKIESLEKQVSELKKEKEDDLFKKRQECEKYRDKILQSSDGDSFQEIFYSPKKETCIIKSDSTSGKPATTFVELKDYLSGEEITYNVDLNCTSDVYKDAESKKYCLKESGYFWSTYKELKGE